MIVYDSPIFTNLKTVNETLSTRYNSNQLMKVLDDLLNRAIEPIVKATDLVDHFFVSCLSWYSANSRRRISCLSKGKIMQMLSVFPLLEEKGKLRMLKRIKLERNIRFKIIKVFLVLAKEYQALEIQELKTLCLVKKSRLRERMLAIQESIGGSDNISSVAYAVDFWYKKALEFRNQIQEKYMRLAAVTANGYYRSCPERFDLNDMAQNFQTAVLKAINKFDPSKGTLSICVQGWLRSAQSPSSNFTHEYGIAYSVPPSVKRSLAKGGASHPVNISSSMELKEVQSLDSGSTPEDHAERESDVLRVRRIAKTADPLGLARLRLGIGELLSSDEQRLLNSARA